MKIEILSTKVNTIPTAKGSYQQLEVAYKNLTFQNKVEGKKLMSFGAGASAFTTLSVAQQGEVFDIETNKNDKGYIDWVSAIKSQAGLAQAPQGTKSFPKETTTAPISRSTYETPEERKLKQQYIVRQSSISSAIELLSVGTKSGLKVDDVLDVARKFERFVFDDNTELDFIADPTKKQSSKSEVAQVFTPDEVQDTSSFNVEVD